MPRDSAATTISDEALVAKIQKGETDLYEQVVKRYQEPLYRYAVTLVHDSDVAKDIVQDSLIKAYTNLRSFNTKKKFSSWLYRITHNRAMDYFRSQRRYTSFELLPELVHSLVSHSDVEATLDETLLREKVTDVIGQLPIRYQEVTALYYLAGKKYGEISEVLHVPEGTVATWLRRSKALLAKALQEYQPKMKKKNEKK
ncbi:RNA polymerase sigma factor [Candidatus Woesebacteria bacterium]|nr:RNA polymerase sigma factor [Candidatus Woesebacteria bacterium]